jgi:hypothetical protein
LSNLGTNFNGYNYIEGSSATNTLTNVDNTIQGSGNIGDNKMALVNEGTIDANQPQTLYVQTSNGLTNSGMLEATNGGTLILEAGSVGATNTGTMLAGSGSALVVNGGVWTNSQTIQNNGGELEFEGNTTINGGAVTLTGAASLVLGPSTINAPVTNSSAGTITVINGAGATISGNLTNPTGGQISIANSNAALTLSGPTLSNGGTITLNSAGSNSSNLIIGASNATLSGGGTVTLSNLGTNFNGYNYIEGSSATNTLTNVDNTIQGSGNIGDNKMGFINDGTVLANQSNTLTIQPSSTGFTNNGILQANLGSTLDVTSGYFTNYISTSNTLNGGTYDANNGTMQLTGVNIVNNAANIILSGANSQITSGANVSALANFATNEPGGVFTLGPGRSFTTTGPGGNFTNLGGLVIGAGDTFEVSGALSNFSGSTLTGGTYYWTVPVIRLLDSAADLCVGPSKRFGRFAVEANVFHQLAGEIGDGSEDATIDHVALDFGEPDLNLIEPRRISRGEMKAYSGILIEESGHSLGLVCREIVQNDVDRLAARSSFDEIGQKSQEVFTGVTPGGLAVNLPCFHVQGRVERERPVTVVFESMFFRPARRERKYRIEAIQRLNRGLFINAENSSMLRRVHVKSDDVGGLLLELRIVARHVTFEPVRFYPRLTPDPVHR